MRELWSFIGSVFSHWMALVGGCAVIILLGLWERFKGVDVPAKVYWLLVLLLLFLAFFLAWRDEHRAKIEVASLLEKTSKDLDAEKNRKEPGLSGFIDEIAMGNPPDGSRKTAIFLTVSVRNKPAALASVAEAWGVSVEIPGKGNFPCQIIHSDRSFELHRSEGGVIAYAPGDTIYDKTSTPIEPGGMKRGTLASILNDLYQDEVWQAGTIIRVTFEDANGKVVAFERTMTAIKNAPLYFPGVQPKVSPPK